MSSTLEILPATQELPDWWNLVAPRGEHEATTGRPQDDLQRAAEDLGRTNPSYEHIWKSVKDADGLWVPVRCNSLRRALLLASSAIQHRTQAHHVKRRGRVVCIKLMKPST